MLDVSHVHGARNVVQSQLASIDQACTCYIVYIAAERLMRL
jgi:hypothetical protein